MSNEAWFIGKALGIPLPCQVDHPGHKVHEPCLALSSLEFPTDSVLLSWIDVMVV